MARLVGPDGMGLATARLIICLTILAAPCLQAQTTMVGPTPYLGPQDTPPLFYAGGSATVIEDFEDCELSASEHGITDDGGACSTTDNRDSVKSDEASDGTRGTAWTRISQITFSFQSPVTAAGLVYTDGPGNLSFRAYGPGNTVLGTIGPFNLDTAPNGSYDDDRFFGVKNKNGITAIQIFGGSSGLEVDHVQYGNMGMLTATWDDGQVVQSNSGGINAALWTGLQITGGADPTVESPDSETVVLTYSGLDPNETLQINVASYGLPFYPPDPIKVIGNQIQVQFSDNGTMRLLLIDINSSSGETIDPQTVTATNASTPPSAATYAFDPPPQGDAEALAIQAALTGGSGPAGGTVISLTLRIVDAGMTALPVATVALARRSAIPTLGMTGLVMLAAALGFVALHVNSKRRNGESL